MSIGEGVHASSSSAHRVNEEPRYGLNRTKCENKGNWMVLLISFPFSIHNYRHYYPRLLWKNGDIER